MFRTSGRMSDSLSRATGRVYRRAWRQLLFAGLVFVGAWVGQQWGITGVAVGVLLALFTNYLMMAQLSLQITGIPWIQFLQAQLPAVRLALLVGGVTLAASAGIRHLGLSHLMGLIAGVLAAGGTIGLSTWLMPTVVLGEHGARLRAILRSQLLLRLRPAHLRGSP
jgi:hypothetical protein